jgi:hypothetical protein
MVDSGVAKKAKGEPMVLALRDFLVYFFSKPSILGVGLAIMFGVIWLAVYRPPLFKDHWLWAVLVGGAILAPIAIFLAEFIAVPAFGELLKRIWSAETLQSWFLLAIVPGLFVNGLCREGIKLVPVVVYWWLKGREISPRIGLAVGAVAGVGFGILEAQWTLNYILASGWSWGGWQSSGVTNLAGFWETFFVVGFNTASCALVGWGLGKGWGWQFYLLAAFAYTILMYTPVLLQYQLISGVQAELIIAGLTLLLAGVVFWLRETGKEEAGN